MWLRVKESFQVLNSLDYDVDYDNDEEPSIGLRTAVPRRQQDSLDIEEEEEEVKEELAAKETDLKVKQPKYFLHNGFFYHRMPYSFYHHDHYGHFQRYHSAVSYPYTYSYYYWCKANAVRASKLSFKRHFVNLLFSLNLRPGRLQFCSLK